MYSMVHERSDAHNWADNRSRSEEHTSELQSLRHLLCRLLPGKQKCALPIRSQEHTSELQYLTHLVCPLLLPPNTLFFFLPPTSPSIVLPALISFFFFNDTATTEIYTLSLHDALPISCAQPAPMPRPTRTNGARCRPPHGRRRPIRRTSSSRARAAGCSPPTARSAAAP